MEYFFPWETYIRNGDQLEGRAYFMADALGTRLSRVMRTPKHFCRSSPFPKEKALWVLPLQTDTSLAECFPCLGVQQILRHQIRVHFACGRMRAVATRQRIFWLETETKFTAGATKPYEIQGWRDFRWFGIKIIINTQCTKYLQTAVFTSYVEVELI